MEVAGSHLFGRLDVKVTLDHVNDRRAGGGEGGIAASTAGGSEQRRGDGKRRQRMQGLSHWTEIGCLTRFFRTGVLQAPRKPTVHSVQRFADTGTVIAPGRSPWLPRVTVALAAILCVLAGTARASASGWTPIHDYAGAVPVLLYHGIHPNTNPAKDPYSVSGAEFARQIQMLSESGFHAISIAQYARFAGGDVAGLPDRPILITFDDGRVDSFQGADSSSRGQGCARRCS